MIARDLENCVGSPVVVQVLPVAETVARQPARLAGACLDEIEVECSDWEINPDLLKSDPGKIVTEDVYTHLLRSLCPVTAQPALLRYVVSFREHNDFHEACIERMFVDLVERCGCEQLTVQARYLRRGGIDINPIRTNTGQTERNLRLWRQ